MKRLLQPEYLQQPYFLFAEKIFTYNIKTAAGIIFLATV